MSTSAFRSIGVLAQQTGCTAPTIRYYEDIGLLPIGPRTDAGRRVYGEAAVRRLTFIRRCRDFGFSIEQVRELVALVDQPDKPCVEVRDVAARHLGQLREKLAELQVLERSLADFVCQCDAACAGGAVIDCTLLEDLAASPRDSQGAQRANCCSAAS
jgi:DNA-binding transcriptional MerR regulator